MVTREKQLQNVGLSVSVNEQRRTTTFTGLASAQTRCWCRWVGITFEKVVRIVPYLERAGQLMELIISMAWSMESNTSESLVDSASSWADCPDDSFTTRRRYHCVNIRTIRQSTSSDLQ